MELNHLKYFYEVAKRGSFTKASKALRVSQPSISKMVKLLEERENVKLLDRAKRGGVYLTPTGKRFYESCVTIFSEVTTLQNVVHDEIEECAGDLSVGASDNICNYVLPNVLEPFLKKHQKVRLKLFSGTSDSIKTELLAGHSEIGFFYTKVREPGFTTESLAFASFAIVYNPSAFPKLALEELQNTPYVGSRMSDYSKPYPTLEMLHSLGITPKSIIETNNQETQKRLALKGYGYTVVPEFMVQSEISKGTLRAIKTSRKIGSSVYLVKRKNRTLTKPAQEFEAHLRLSLVKRLSGAAKARK